MAILVDGLLDGDVAYDLFGRLRDELWELGHVWLVAARPRDSGQMRTPPADAFWGTVVEIPPLSTSEVEELLCLGLDDDEQRLVFDSAAEWMAAELDPRDVIRSAQWVWRGVA